MSVAGLTAEAGALAISGRFVTKPNRLVDLLNASTGRSTPTMGKLKQFIISESFASGVSMARMAKDIQTADELAHHIGVEAPVADEIIAM